MQHLFLLRGNSGSGKTTAANALRTELRGRFGKESTMLVPQDVVRIDILGVKDTGENLSIGLIKTVCEYGMNAGQHVILEGILDRWKYGAMLRELLTEWVGQTHVFYYDIPLDVTLERHDLRPQKNLFTKEQMRGWYNSDNRLGVAGERILTADISLEEAVQLMIQEMRA